MYKQTDRKEELFNAIQDFHHEFINENLMISHKMLGENHQHNLNNLFVLFSNAFDFTGIELVSKTIRMESRGSFFTSFEGV